MTCSTPGFPALYHLPKFVQIHVHWASDVIQPSYPLLPLFLLPSIFPNIRIFSNELTICIRQPKDWSFNLASVLPMNIQGWSPLGLIGFISLLSKGFSRVFSNTTILWLKTSFHQHSAFFMIQLSHLYMTTGKTIALTRWPIVGKAMSLLFNIPFMFVIASIPRNKGLLILWLQSLSAVILELKKMKSDTVLIFSLSICHEVMGPYTMIFLFWMLNFKPAFPLSSFTFIKRLFSSSSLSAFKVVTFVYL